MLNAVRATRGMAVASHSLAAQSALAVLREGGNAIEAIIAGAATIAVAYPHMNGIGGDSFWTIAPPGGAPPIGIEACGTAARAISIDWYAERGFERIPGRGPLSACTVAGTVSGWDVAAEVARAHGGTLPPSRLLEDAIWYAEHGVPVTASQHENTRRKYEELVEQPGFAQTFLVDGDAPATGSLQQQPALANTLRRLTRDGFDAFYRGELARETAADLAAVGSPVALDDLTAFRARRVTPLHLRHSMGDLYNMTPPTQGLVSLIILAILDRLGLATVPVDGAEYVHLIVEATKQAFAVRDRYVTDPDHMTIDAQDALSEEFLAPYVAAIARDRAKPWGRGRVPADTVWMGAIDANGCAVSFIQSIYHEFGSGVVLPQTGINWQNRGCSFSLDPNDVNALRPGKKPFHTLNPALARLHDGRTMVYGTMGGDGQPQTQAAVFTRCALFGQSPQEAVTAPRWLLGRTWGSSSDSLKLESRFPREVLDGLRALGHDVEVLGAFEETMGHAGAIVRHADGTLEGGADPRSDGTVASF
ncbi:MAG TPA: gamma-glutamyltransferase family protein [Candidatus Limnocylindria bacterium]|jgi:gamma-glutamyltranspeptidase|nr:gamma-glutamyltransferase family protein [Candidatus Limnocylindria bacterium]